MGEVHLRPITRDNFRECVSLQVEDDQKQLVASTVQSLAEAYVNPALVPLAIYGRAA